LNLLADSEHLGAASRADALGSGFTILHGNRFGVLHFLLRATLYTIIHARLSIGFTTILSLFKKIFVSA
jgi:hypothetical protein